jgi:hypothetical protein
MSYWIGWAAGLIAGLLIGSEAYKYYAITLPMRTACKLCGWMRGSGHAPICSQWRPKPGEMEQAVEEFTAEVNAR